MSRAAIVEPLMHLDARQDRNQSTNFCMPITCPECLTTYQVADSEIGDKGRSVKCIKCANVWHAYLDEPQLEASIVSDTGAGLADNAKSERPSAAVQETPEKIRPEPRTIDYSRDRGQASVAPPAIETPLPEATNPTIDAEGGAPGVQAAPDAVEGDIAQPNVEGSDTTEAAEKGISEESTGIIANVNEVMGAIRKESDQNKLTEAKARSPGAGPVVRTEIKKSKTSFVSENFVGFAAIALVLCLLAAAFGFREQMVRFVPEVAGLYKAVGLEVNLRGLKFSNVTTVADFENGTSVLVVNGTINNVSRAATQVPTVRLALRNQRGQEVYAWSYQPTVESLGVGESVGFTTRVASPPDGASDIQLLYIGDVHPVNAY